MSDEFRDTVAVVTGASSGIGRATAERLAGEGARVVVFARTRQALGSLAAKHGERMIAVAGDVSDPAAIENLFAEAERRFGPCRILVNAAGMIDPRLMVQTSPEEWDRMFAVNVRGAFLASRRALPSMLSAGGGAIVNVASISGVVGPEKFPGFVSYCASKAAVIALTEALAVEIRERNVRVNCISPGSVDTKMWKRAGGGAPADMTAEEVAEAVVFLASDRSRPMNGQNLRLW